MTPGASEVLGVPWGFAGPHPESPAMRLAKHRLFHICATLGVSDSEWQGEPVGTGLSKSPGSSGLPQGALGETGLLARAELGFVCPCLAATLIGGRLGLSLQQLQHLGSILHASKEAPVPSLGVGRCPAGLMGPGTQAIALSSGDGQLSSRGRSLLL